MPQMPEDQSSYDSLDDAEQAAVRAEWDRRIRERRETLDLTEVIGDDWVEADEDGRVVQP